MLYCKKYAWNNISIKNYTYLLLTVKTVLGDRGIECIIAAVVVVKSIFLSDDISQARLN